MQSNTSTSHIHSKATIAPAIEDVIRLFNQTFIKTQCTKLICGEDEPNYIPANSQCAYHQIVFAHGYVASALHEIAHWCIAGPQRRLLQDYGYWYCPDGRDKAQQCAFEKVEIKPQAIEWAFSMAVGKEFRVSTDNLNGAQPDTVHFSKQVAKQAKKYLQTGFPPRAQEFIAVLQEFYGTKALSSEQTRNIQQ